MTSLLYKIRAQSPLVSFRGQLTRHYATKPPRNDEPKDADSKSSTHDNKPEDHDTDPARTPGTEPEPQNHDNDPESRNNEPKDTPQPKPKLKPSRNPSPEPSSLQRATSLIFLPFRSLFTRTFWEVCATFSVFELDPFALIVWVILAFLPFYIIWRVCRRTGIILGVFTETEWEKSRREIKGRWFLEWVIHPEELERRKEKKRKRDEDLAERKRRREEGRRACWEWKEDMGEKEGMVYDFPERKDHAEYGAMVEFVRRLCG